MPREEEFELDLIDLIKYCWKKKWKFIQPMLAAGVLLVIFCVLTIVVKPEKSMLPNQYTSTAKILVRETSSTSGISSSLASLASLGGVDLSGSTKLTNGVLLTNIAGTNSYKDAIVNKFDLVGRFKIRKNLKTNSRKALKKRLEVKLDEKTNVLSVSYTDIDPEFAYEVAKYAADILMEKFYDVSADDDAINLRNYQEAMDASFKKIVQFQVDIQNLEQSVSNSSAATIPSIMFDVQMKKLELEAEETIYASFRGQHELLSIQMQDNPTTLKLIQEAEVSEIKSGPSRAKICIIGEILVFLGCFGYVFVTYYMQKKKEFEKKAKAQGKEVAK